MIKIDILIPDFKDLGAQRVAINIANALSSYYDVCFVVLSDEGPFKFYLDDKINIMNLSLKCLPVPKLRVISRATAYAKHVKNRKTQISISFSPITNVYVLYAKYKYKNLKVIIQEHGYPSLALEDKENINWLNKRIYKYIIRHHYNKADKFITIADAIKEDFVKNFSIREDLMEIIRNPINIGLIESKSNENVDDFNFYPNIKYLIGVGRLVTQKNFSFLIDIFQELLNHYRDIQLIILGEGPLELDLKNKIKNLGLEGKVHLLGFKQNPYKYISRSKILCLTSVWEGLPQIIAEAMICKTLIVAHKCKSGPEEMIEDGKTGFLVEYNQKWNFVERLKYCLENIENLVHITSNAYEYAKNEYSIQKAINAYNKIIDELKNEI